MTTQKTYICKSCKTEYQLMPKPNAWVNKQSCKKCYMADLERFNNGPGLLIQIALIAVLIISAAVGVSNCGGISRDNEFIPRNY